MIGQLTVKISAKDPTRKCETFRAFVGSPSNVRIVDVPTALGNWKISTVYFTVNYPDNRSVSKTCKPGVGVYVATIEGSTIPGKSLLGYTVKADGVDENNQPVIGYVLGKGDVEIVDADATLTPGETTFYIHLLTSRPETPHKGDAYVDGGVWWFYNGSAWVTLGGTFAGNGWAQYPQSQGGDGKWHRVIIANGALSYVEQGFDEPTDAAPFALKSELTAETERATAAEGANATAISNHADAKNNPHGVTKAQVGLGRVNNTSDAEKPVSNAMQTALNAKANDNAVVHLEKNETIRGTKIFTSVDAADVILIKSETDDSSVDDSLQHVYPYIRWVDKNNLQCGMIAHNRQSNGEVWTVLSAKSNTGNSANNEARIILIVDKNSNVRTLNGMTLDKVKGSAFAAAGMLSNTFIDNVLINGGSYTANANGWCVFSALSGSSGDYVQVATFDFRGPSTSVVASGPSQRLSVTIPVSKGAVIMCSWIISGSGYISKNAFFKCNAEVD